MSHAVLACREVLVEILSNSVRLATTNSREVLLADLTFDLVSVLFGVTRDFVRLRIS